MTATVERANISPEARRVVARAVDGSTLFTLTVQQARVVRLIADGLTNREIGDRLFLTEDTVKTHMSRLMKAMGARTRAHVVHLAHLGGLFDVDTPTSVSGSPSALERSYGDQHLASCALFAIRYCDCAERRRRGGRR